MNEEPKSNPVSIREARRTRCRSSANYFANMPVRLNLDLGFQGFDQELATLPGHYARPQGRLLLAFFENEVAGCVGLRPFDEGRCEMKRLYVRPAYRGRRIGEALIGRFLEEARGIGRAGEETVSGLHDQHVPRYQRVVLDTVSPLMAGAIAMYKKTGFREIPPYRPNPLCGALYMELQL